MMSRDCRVCGVELNDKNWYPSQQKSRNCICKECNKVQSRVRIKKSPEKERERKRSWREANPDKIKAQWTRANRKIGKLPMSENKECSQYLGIYVNERLLKHYFDDVEVMPPNNPGYDFVCNKDKKIDGKSSCLHKDGRWSFNINCNTITDYFFCVAYDNRKDLNLVHIWLIPGDKLNHLKTASISKSTIDKWSEYEQPIDKLSACCDAMKSDA